MRSRTPTSQTPPDRGVERALLRRLAGEPGGDDTAGAPSAERFAALWERLEPPPPDPAPLGFSGRVMARVRDEASRSARRSTGLSIAWARAAGATALAVGIAAGAGLGQVVLPAGSADGAVSTEVTAAVPVAGAGFDDLAVAWSASLAGDDGLAEGYAEAIESIADREDG